mgnify:CR=1 FL=1
MKSKYVYYIYLIISVGLIPVLNNFTPILREEYSWWLVPVLVVAFFLGFIILQILLFLGMILFTDLNKPIDKTEKLFRFLLKASLPVILKAALVKIDKKGFEKELPENTRMLFVCNHRHDFDPVIILSSFPQQDIGFIGKKEIFTTMPFIARAMHRMRSLPIDRENDREAAKTVVNAIKIIKEDKASIALFPEGYTSLSGELLPFRNGSFKIATKAGVPIVVCALMGTKALSKRIFRRPSRVEIRLLDIIYPEQYEGKNTQEIGEIIHKEMEDALKEMRK